MKDILTSRPLHCRLKGSGEAFDLFSHSDGPRTQNITYQGSQNASQLSIFQITSHFKYVICQGLLLSVWSVTLPPPLSCSCCGPTRGGPGPRVPALQTHTSLLSLPPFSSPSTALVSLLSISLFSPPFCSASFLFQTNGCNSLTCFFVLSEKKLFLLDAHAVRVCVWETGSTREHEKSVNHKQLTICQIRKAAPACIFPFASNRKSR